MTPRLRITALSMMAALGGLLAAWAALGISAEGAWVALVVGWAFNVTVLPLYNHLMVQGMPEKDRPSELVGSLLISCVPWAFTALVVVTLVGAGWIQARQKLVEDPPWHRGTLPPGVYLVPVPENKGQNLAMHRAFDECVTPDDRPPDELTGFVRTGENSALERGVSLAILTNNAGVFNAFETFFLSDGEVGRVDLYRRVLLWSGDELQAVGKRFEPEWLAYFKLHDLWLRTQLREEET